MVVLGEELGTDAEGMVGGVAHAEHPLVPANGADRFADLVGKSLEGELVVGGGEGRGDAIRRALLVLDGEEGVDGFFKLATEEVLISFEGDRARGIGGEFFGEVKTIDRLKEKDGANAVVEVVRLATEGIELLALGEEGGGVERSTGFGK